MVNQSFTPARWLFSEKKLEKVTRLCPKTMIVIQEEGKVHGTLTSMDP